MLAVPPKAGKQKAFPLGILAVMLDEVPEGAIVRPRYGQALPSPKLMEQKPSRQRLREAREGWFWSCSILRSELEGWRKSIHGVKEGGSEGQGR